MSKRINNYNISSTSPSIQISNTNTIGNLFTTGGNVGINTTSPQFTLDVSGTARITNSLTTGSLFSTTATIPNIFSTGITTGSLFSTTATIPNIFSTGITTSSLNISGGNVNISDIGKSLLISNRLSSLGYIYNARTAGSLSYTNNISIMNKRIKTSPQNAINTVSTWTLRSQSTLINKIIWTSELSIFVGSFFALEFVHISYDGITWVEYPTPIGIGFSEIIWVPELVLFIATYSNAQTTNAIYTSPNAITWTQQTTPNLALSGVCWSPELNLLVALNTSATANTSGVITSPDGINWTQQTTPSSRSWSSVCWSSELSLFVTCSSFTSTNCIMTSSNGINWSLQTTPSTIGFSIIWVPELYRFIVSGSDSSDILSSQDGFNWITNTTPFVVNSIIWSPELSIFIITRGDDSSTTSIFSGFDGINWIQQTTPSMIATTGCWSPELSLFVVCNNNGGVATSNIGLPNKLNTLLAPRSQINISNGNLNINGNIVTAMNTADIATGQTSSLICALSSQLFSANTVGNSTGVVVPLAGIGQDAGLYKGTSAQFDFWRTYTNLVAGTYTFRLDFGRNADRGIVTVVLNGTNIGTIDTYGGTNGRIVGEINSVVVANSGVYKVELQVNAKNASSSNFIFVWNLASFIRTA